MFTTAKAGVGTGHQCVCRECWALHIIEGLLEDWHRLDARIGALSNEIGALVCQDPACDRLMSVPGIGSIIASAMVAAIGDGSAFSKGRDFGAWLGLVRAGDCARQQARPYPQERLHHGTTRAGIHRHNDH
jgi:hypothetical protein